MAETIMACIVLLMALYGCVEGIRWVILQLAYPPRSRRAVRLIPLCGHRTDVEYVVRGASAYRRWNAVCGEEVFLLDIGADKETCALAKEACRVVGDVEFVKGEDLPQLLMEFSEKPQK